MKRKLSNVSCKYGAPMGRSNHIPEDSETAGKLHLEKLKWIDGDYDQGGAYWGRSDVDGDIYWAYGETKTEQIDVFVRAHNRTEAKEEILNYIPKAIFYK
jgi:hypothetical protein